MSSLPHLRFVEQYDPADLSSGALSQPFAFVADRVELCHLSLDVSDTMERGVVEAGNSSSRSWDALLDLREQLAPEQKLGWWIVYNGDESRLSTAEGETAGTGTGAGKGKGKGKGGGGGGGGDKVGKTSLPNPHPYPVADGLDGWPSFFSPPYNTPFPCPSLTFPSVFFCRRGNR